MSKRVVGFVKDVDETVHYIIGYKVQDLAFVSTAGLDQHWVSWQVFTCCGREHKGDPTTQVLQVTCIRCLDQTAD